MQETPQRIALVGAATLQGKALNDELSASAFGAADFQLMDDEEALGKLEAAGDEVTFVQRIEPESFERSDFTFFAAFPEITRKHWRESLRAGSRIVDLSGALENEPGVMVRAPWLSEEFGESAQNPAPDLHTSVVVSAHPIAVLLALISGRSQRLSPLHAMWTTLLQPASEYGHAALEELHQQTVNLLSFQPLPTKVFGSQTSFNLAVSFGEEGRVNLTAAGETIRRHFALIACAPAPPFALNIVQAPTFHGYGLSVGLEFEHPITTEALSQSLAGMHIHVVPSRNEFPGNVQAVEEDDIQVLVQAEAAGHAATKRFWLWIVADNLKLAAKNAVGCALELERLRPRGKVQ